MRSLATAVTVLKPPSVERVAQPPSSRTPSATTAIFDRIDRKGFASFIVGSSQLLHLLHVMARRALPPARDDVTGGRLLQGELDLVTFLHLLRERAILQPEEHGHLRQA